MRNEEEIVQCILSHRKNLNREEIMRMIRERKVASGGFLTDKTAARLVAAELGLEIKPKKAPPKIYIRQLVSGLNDVTISGRVLSVTTPKRFSRQNKNGQIAKLLVADKTGTIKVVLWNDKAEIVGKIQPRMIVKILHGYVRHSRNGEAEIHVGQRGIVKISPFDVKKGDLPPIKNFLKKIADISQTHRNVNFEGVIKKMFPLSSFQRRDGTIGKVLRLIIEDETGSIPVIFWNEKAENVVKLEEGASILLMNAKVEKNRQERALKLHVEDFTYVETMLA